jgi:hypothetical protein
VPHEKHRSPRRPGDAPPTLCNIGNLNLDELTRLETQQTVPPRPGVAFAQVRAYLWRGARFGCPGSDGIAAVVGGVAWHGTGLRQYRRGDDRPRKDWSCIS